MSKIIRTLMHRKLIALMSFVVIIIGGYFGYQGLTKEESTVSYTTAAVEKGTLIVSLSGSGQVSASDQVDIKPASSGELTGFYITKDQEVKAGQLLAVIDASDAQRAVNEAEISLESAEIDLEELLSPPDAQDLLRAQNALAQAERNLEIAKRDYENIDEDIEDALADAYEDGYSEVSASFFKLSDYMEDLQDALGTEEHEEEYIGSYKLILGANSSLVQRFVNDCEEANRLYNETFSFFGDVFQSDERDQVYKLIDDTLKTAEAVSRALESARHMYDAISNKSYSQYYIASTIDSMKPKIESDISGAFSLAASLQNTVDDIDEMIENKPDKIKDAELALRSAEENAADKKIALEELEAGADSLDIRVQRNIVAQKEASLADAKAELADRYIYAPFSGTVADVNSDLRKGDNVSSASVLATLVTKQKIAEITLNEIDIAQVKTGQKANITFDALEDLNITGEVAEIDALGTVSQGVVSYGLKIVFDAQDERIKPGMTLSANIITEARQYVLMVQSSAIKEQGGISYVQTADSNALKSNSGAASVSGATISASNLHLQQVELGLSNDTMTEIVSGLEEGDVVITQTISSGSASSQSQQSSGSGFNSGMMRMMR